MSKMPTPKADQLRALREAKFARAEPPGRKPVETLRQDMAAIPAKKTKKEKRRG